MALPARHWKAVARLLGRHGASGELVTAVCNLFVKDGGRFDPEWFMQVVTDAQFERGEEIVAASREAAAEMHADEEAGD